MKKETQGGDIIEFLKEGKAQDFVLGGQKWSGPFCARGIALQGFWGGYFPLKELFYLILPRSKRPKQLREKFNDYLSNRMKVAVIPFLKGDAVTGFSREIFASKENLGILGLVASIYELIIEDEYHAKDSIKKDSIVIDAGANIGIFSLFAANIALDGEIYAFEPLGATFQILQKNAESYNNIHCFQRGLGDVDAEKRFYVSVGQTTGNTFEDSAIMETETKPDDFGRSEVAKIITIDEFVLDHKLSRVDLIKIDTEGYEERILRGAKETIKKWHPALVMSAYHNPVDMGTLPALINSISPDYLCRLDESSGEKLIFAEVPHKGS
jgi:FkbM family methyltransferase